MRATVSCLPLQKHVQNLIEVKILLVSFKALISVSRKEGVEKGCGFAGLF